MEQHQSQKNLLLFNKINLLKRKVPLNEAMDYIYSPTTTMPSWSSSSLTTTTTTTSTTPLSLTAQPTNLTNILLGIVITLMFILVTVLLFVGIVALIRHRIKAKNRRSFLKTTTPNPKSAGGQTNAQESAFLTAPAKPEASTVPTKSTSRDQILPLNSVNENNYNVILSEVFC